MILKKPGKYVALKDFEIKGDNGWKNIWKGRILNITQVKPEWPYNNWMATELLDWVSIIDIPIKYVGECDGRID